jgi:DNA/RNA endonuclease YhcR with UshA esterase domain
MIAGMNKKFLFAAVAAVLMAAGVTAWAAEEKPAAPAAPASPVAPADAAPVKVDMTKKDQIDAAMDKEAIVAGTVESAKWTKTGKTLQVKFKDAPDDFRVVMYGKNREELDKAFDGDIAKAVDGKQVEVTGKVRKYPGSVETWKKYTEVQVLKPEQIKVVTKAADEKK